MSTEFNWKFGLSLLFLELSLSLYGFDTCYEYNIQECHDNHHDFQIQITEKKIPMRPKEKINGKNKACEKSERERMREKNL